MQWKRVSKFSGRVLSGNWETWPRMCVTPDVRCITKSVRSMSDIDGGLKEKYELPIQQWLLEAGERNKEYLQS